MTATATSGVRVTRVPLDTREVTVSVVGMDAEPDGLGRMFVPDRGAIYYRRFFGQPWQGWVALSGPRVRIDGSLSTTTRTRRTYWMPGDTTEDYQTRRVVPEFLREFVEHYWPPR